MDERYDDSGRRIYAWESSIYYGRDGSHGPYGAGSRPHRDLSNFDCGLREWNRSNLWGGESSCQCGSCRQRGLNRAPKPKPKPTQAPKPAPAPPPKPRLIPTKLCEHCHQDISVLSRRPLRLDCHCGHPWPWEMLAEGVAPDRRLFDDDLPDHVADVADVAVVTAYKQAIMARGR